MSDKKEPEVYHSYGYRNKEQALVRYYKELEHVGEVLRFPPRDVYVTITKTEMED